MTSETGNTPDNCAQTPTLLRGILSLLVVAGLWSLFVWIHWPFFGVPYSVVRLIGNRWEWLALTPGEPLRLHVSPSGRVWAFGDAYPDKPRFEVSRLDGGHWVRYASRELGVDRHSRDYAITSSGEQLWVAMSHALLHFDGRKWTRDLTAPLIDPVSIAADGADVWVLDGTPALAHFDGANWTVVPMREAFAGHSWTWREWQYGGLAVTREHRIWLVWDGVWRYNGAAWEEVRPEGEGFPSIRLAGISDDGLLVWTDRELLAISGYGHIARRFPIVAMELRGKPATRVSLLQDGRLVVQDPQGYVILDDGRWQRLNVSRSTDAAYQSELAEGGTLRAWAPHGFFTPGRLMQLIGPFLICLAVPAWFQLVINVRGVRDLRWLAGNHNMADWLTLVSAACALALVGFCVMTTSGRAAQAFANAFSTQFPYLERHAGWIETFLSNLPMAGFLGNSIQPVRKPPRWRGMLLVLAMLTGFNLFSETSALPSKPLLIAACCMGAVAIALLGWTAGAIAAPRQKQST